MRAFFLALLRALGWGLAALVILAALALGAAQLFTPVAEHYREDVERWASEIARQPVTIGGFKASWHGLGPSVELSAVQVFDAARAHALLKLDSARVDLSLSTLLSAGRLEPVSMTVRGAGFAVVRDPEGKLSIEGLQSSPGEQAAREMAEWIKGWLQRQDHLVIEDSTVVWRDMMRGGAPLPFRDVRLRLFKNGDWRHLSADVSLPGHLGKSLALIAEISGGMFDPAQWRGRVYLQGVHVKPAGFLNGYVLPDSVALTSGQVDMQAWGEWRGGHLARLEGHVAATAMEMVRTPGTEDSARESSTGAESPPSTVETIATATPDTTGSDTTSTTPAHTSGARIHRVTLDAASGGFLWQRRERGWSLDIGDFTLTRHQQAWPAGELRVVYAPSETGGRRYDMGFRFLRAGDVAELLSEIGFPPPDTHETLATLRPGGELRDGYVRYETRPDAPPYVMARAAFGGAHWQPWKRVPGARNLAGTIAFDNDGGALALDSADAHLHVKAANETDMFRQPLAADTLRGNIAWIKQGEDWNVRLRDASVRNADIAAEAQARLTVSGGGHSPYLDLIAGFHDGNGEHVSRYLPVAIMPPAAVEWLDRGIVSGKVTAGDVAVQGYLRDFPFDDTGNGSRGRFTVHFAVEDAIIDYAPRWPRLEEVDGEVVFSGRSFAARATAGKTFDSTITQAEAGIADLHGHPSVLTVQGKARGPVADALRFVRESPLAQKNFGRYLEGMRASGAGRLDLDLSLPLNHDPARVKGNLSIKDSVILLEDGKIDLTQVDGALGFSETGLSARNVTARLLGQEAVIGARSSGGTTVFEAQGKGSPAAIMRRFDIPWNQYASGDTNWNAALSIPAPDGKGAELRVESGLNGVAVSLPEPLAKTGAQTVPFTLKLPLPLDAARPLDAAYGAARARLALQRTADGVQVERGEVRFGGATAVLPDTPLVRIAGDVTRFSKTQWDPVLWPEKPPAPAEARARDEALIGALDVRVAELEFFDRRFSDVKINAQRGPREWTAQITSAQIEGLARIPHDEHEPLVLDMERLRLKRLPPGGAAQQDSTTDPRALRPVRLDSKEFAYGDWNLGALHLRTAPSPDGLRVTELQTRSATDTVRATGEWRVADARQESAFSIALDSDDFGKTLAGLGYADVIQGGKARIVADTAWPGSPGAFTMDRLSGKVDLIIKDGNLLEVEPGAGRIFGLLSFQALPRRLTLDFSDLFQKGFSFDTIAGDFRIEAGNAFTDNLFMDGPAARIEVKGRVGLAREDYDQQVTVWPHVTAGLPLAGAVVGGIGTGAVVYLAEKLLKPGIEGLTRVEYSVKGSWDKPVIEQTGKLVPPAGGETLKGTEGERTQ